MKHFKIAASWVNSNVFVIEVREYKVIKRFLRKDELKLVHVYHYTSWEDFMSIMWKNHLIDNNITTWEIDLRI